MRRRSTGASRVFTATPSRRTSPRSGSISRLMSFIAVVFPEPEAPTRAMKLFASTAREMSRSAKLCPSSKDLLTSSNSMRGGAMDAYVLIASFPGARSANPESRLLCRRHGRLDPGSPLRGAPE